jgi:RNA polymerase subunit RPABC4/transcription elongation factor Spt4
MRYCFHCSRITVGQPQFCNFCGRTYDSKLCPRLHDNPREAQVCNQCGSRDLTLPQPKLALWIRPLLFLFSLLPGVALLILTIGYLFLYIYIWFTDPSRMLAVLMLGLVVGMLWLLYMEMPRFMRRAVRRRMRRD